MCMQRPASQHAVDPAHTACERSQSQLASHHQCISPLPATSHPHSLQCFIPHLATMFMAGQIKGVRVAVSPAVRVGEGGKCVGLVWGLCA